MTHRGPFQHLPFCDSVILYESAMFLIYTTNILLLCHTECWVLPGEVPPKELNLAGTARAGGKSFREMCWRRGEGRRQGL